MVCSNIWLEDIFRIAGRRKKAGSDTIIIAGSESITRMLHPAQINALRYTRRHPRPDTADVVYTLGNGMPTHSTKLRQQK